MHFPCWRCPAFDRSTRDILCREDHYRGPTNTRAKGGSQCLSLVLATNTESFDKFAVTSNVCCSQVVEQATTTTDEQKQATT